MHSPLSDVNVDDRKHPKVLRPIYHKPNCRDKAGGESKRKVQNKKTPDYRKNIYLIVFMSSGFQQIASAFYNDWV